MGFTEKKGPETKAPNAAGTLGRLRYALESRRQPEPEPPVTLRCNPHQETVMLAAACNRVPDDGAHEPKPDRTDGCLA